MWLHVAFESGLVGALLITGFAGALLARGLRFQRETGLLSHTLVLTIFLLLADIMSVIIGGKLSTPYGLLLLLAVQEERLRSLARAYRDPPPQPAASLMARFKALPAASAG
jgi:hypothetical protein